MSTFNSLFIAFWNVLNKSFTHTSRYSLLRRRRHSTDVHKIWNLLYVFDFSSYLSVAKFVPLRGVGNSYASTVQVQSSHSIGIHCAYIHISTVRIVTSYGLGNEESWLDSRQDKGLLSSPKSLDQLWMPSSPLVQRVNTPSALSLRVEQPRLESDNSSPFFRG